MKHRSENTATLTILVMRSVCAFGTLLLTGSAVGTTEAASQLDNLLAPGTPLLDENGKRIEVDPAPRPEVRPLRFDLDCDYQGRVVADPNPRPRHWLPCSEDPTYRPGRIENETYFSEEEINDQAEP